MIESGKVLTRRLYLQRYVTRVFNDLVELQQPNDKALLALLSEFIADADTKTLIALSQQRKSNSDVKALLDGIKQLIKEQELLVSGYFAEELPKLVDSEMVYIAAGGTVASSRGVVSLPVAGQTYSSRVSDAYQKVLTRNISTITQLAATDPQSITKEIRGAKDNNYKDGLLSWRNERLVKPEADVIVNGTATNANLKAYDDYNIEKVDWLATLDYRVCISCAAAEMGSPYLIHEAPKTPKHPRCRCVVVGHIEGMTSERPFVKDDRSLSKIPKKERVEKVGQTRKGMEWFLGEMPDDDLKDFLGPARYQLFKDGKVKDIKKMVDEATFEPLTLEELPK